MATDDCQIEALRRKSAKGQVTLRCGGTSATMSLQNEFAFSFLTPLFLCSWSWSTLLSRRKSCGQNPDKLWQGWTSSAHSGTCLAWLIAWISISLWFPLDLAYTGTWMRWSPILNGQCSPIVANYRGPFRTMMPLSRGTNAEGTLAHRAILITDQRIQVTIAMISPEVWLHTQAGDSNHSNNSCEGQL